MATIYRLRFVVFSLLLMLFMAVIGLSFIVRDRQKYDAALINIVGRQRMLAQQMALQAVLVRTYPNGEYRQALHHTSHESFETIMTALTDGGQIALPTEETFTIRPISDEEARKQLLIVNGIWEEIDREIHVVLAENLQSEDLNASVDKIIGASPNLIRELDKLTKSYEEASNRNIARLQEIQIGLLAAAALLLGALIAITNRRVLQPIRSLGEAAARIGKGNLETPVAVTGLGEINLLARNLDEMRGKLKTSMRTQVALVDLSQCHLKATDEEKAIQCAVRTAAQVLGADYSSVALLDPDGRLIVRAAWGIPAKRVRGMELEQENKSQTGFTILQGKPILVQDYGKLTGFSVPPLVTELEISSGLSVPMLSRGKIIGAMLAHSKTPRHFDQESIPILSLIANQTAITVDKIRLHNETRELARDASK